MDLGLSLPQPAPAPQSAVPAHLASPGSRAAAERAAKEFEAIFIGQMTETMFSGLKAEEPFGGGHAETLWRSMLAQEMGSSMARAGGIGVADAVLRSMLDMQEEAGR